MNTKWKLLKLKQSAQKLEYWKMKEKHIKEKKKDKNEARRGGPAYRWSIFLPAFPFNYNTLIYTLQLFLPNRVKYRNVFVLRSIFLGC